MTKRGLSASRQDDRTVRTLGVHVWPSLYPRTMRAVWLAGIGVALSIGVAWHEWSYRQTHHGHTGVSGVFVVLAIACGCGCLSAALTAWEREEEVRRRNRDYWSRRKEIEDQSNRNDTGEG